jgi:hypothetical protein
MKRTWSLETIEESRELVKGIDLHICIRTVTEGNSIQRMNQPHVPYTSGSNVREKCLLNTTSRTPAKRVLIIGEPGEHGYSAL